MSLVASSEKQFYVNGDLVRLEIISVNLAPIEEGTVMRFKVYSPDIGSSFVDTAPICENSLNPPSSSLGVRENVSRLLVCTRSSHLIAIVKWGLSL